MTGTPTLMSSWGAVPNLNSSSGTAQMANSREMQVDEAGDTRAAPSTPTDHSGYLKPPISPTLSETPVKVTATPVPIPVPVPPLAPEFSLQQMQPYVIIMIASIQLNLCAHILLLDVQTTAASDCKATTSEDCLPAYTKAFSSCDALGERCSRLYHEFVCRSNTHTMRQ